VGMIDDYDQWEKISDFYILLAYRFSHGFLSFGYLVCSHLPISTCATISRCSFLTGLLAVLGLQFFNLDAADSASFQEGFGVVSY